MRDKSSQLPEFVRGQAGIAGNAAHGVRVYRICPGDYEPRLTIGHDDMPALPDDAIVEASQIREWRLDGGYREFSAYQTMTSASLTLKIFDSSASAASHS